MGGINPNYLLYSGGGVWQIVGDGSGTTYITAPAGVNVGILAPGGQSIFLGGGPTSVSGLCIANNGVQFVAQSASTTTGVMWLDSTQKTIMAYPNGIAEYSWKTVYSQWGSVTVGNTNVATTLIGGTSKGTNTIPANYLVTEKRFRVTCSGTIANTATPTGRWQLKFGSTVVSATASNTMATITGTTQWNAIFEGVCTAIGSGTSALVFMDGQTEYFSTTIVPNRMQSLDQAAGFDSTATQAITPVFTWGTQNVANTMTCSKILIEVGA